MNETVVFQLDFLYHTPLTVLVPQRFHSNSHYLRQKEIALLVELEQLLSALLLDRL